MHLCTGPLTFVALLPQEGQGREIVRHGPVMYDYSGQFSRGRRIGVGTETAVVRGPECSWAIEYRGMRGESSLPQGFGALEVIVARTEDFPTTTRASAAATAAAAAAAAVAAAASPSTASAAGGPGGAAAAAATTPGESDSPRRHTDLSVEAIERILTDRFGTTKPPPVNDGLCLDSNAVGARFAPNKPFDRYKVFGSFANGRCALARRLPLLHVATPLQRLRLFPTLTQVPPRCGAGRRAMAS